MLTIALADEWTFNPATGEIEAIGTTPTGDVIRCRVTLEAVADLFGCEPTPEAGLAAARTEAETVAVSWRYRAVLRELEPDGSLLIG